MELLTKIWPLTEGKLANFGNAFLAQRGYAGMAKKGGNLWLPNVNAIKKPMV